MSLVNEAYNNGVEHYLEKVAYQDTLGKELLAAGATGLLPFGSAIHSAAQDVGPEDSRLMNWAARFGGELGGGLGGTAIGAATRNPRLMAALGRAGSVGGEVGGHYLMHKDKYDDSGKLKKDYR